MAKFNPSVMIKNIENEIVDKQKDYADKILKKIIDTSPVKSGHYKLNNKVSIDTRDYSEVPGVDPGGSSALQRGRAKIDQVKKLGHEIIIQNNVEYADSIEFGHSDQAPAGVYRVALLGVAR